MKIRWGLIVKGSPRSRYEHIGVDHIGTYHWIYDTENPIVGRTFLFDAREEADAHGQNVMRILGRSNGASYRVVPRRVP